MEAPAEPWGPVMWEPLTAPGSSESGAGTKGLKKSGDIDICKI